MRQTEAQPNQKKPQGQTESKTILPARRAKKAKNGFLLIP
jgi:hypothetical protein